MPRKVFRKPWNIKEMFVGGWRPWKSILETYSRKSKKYFLRRDFFLIFLVIFEHKRPQAIHQFWLFAVNFRPLDGTKSKSFDFFILSWATIDDLQKFFLELLHDSINRSLEGWDYVISIVYTPQNACLCTLYTSLTLSKTRLLNRSLRQWMIFWMKNLQMWVFPISTI